MAKGQLPESSLLRVFDRFFIAPVSGLGHWSVTYGFIWSVTHIIPVQSESLIMSAPQNFLVIIFNKVLLYYIVIIGIEVLPYLVHPVGFSFLVFLDSETLAVACLLSFFLLLLLYVLFNALVTSPPCWRLSSLLFTALSWTLHFVFCLISWCLCLVLCV